MVGELMSGVMRPMPAMGEAVASLGETEDGEMDGSGATAR